MTDRQMELTIGSLLHDVGKVIYRSGDKRRHSKSGYDFLKDEAGVVSDRILECVRYHHSLELKNASIEKDSLAYIAYIADNIAVAADRRTNELEDYGFEISSPLESVFNILNGNKKQCYYKPTLMKSDSIPYPAEDKISFDETFYNKVKADFTDNLKGIEHKREYINSLLALEEVDLSYVPSSTSRQEVADISLYDHQKMTAAIAACIEQYLNEQNIVDYKDALYEHSEDFYSKKSFLMYSSDVSGIQKFIYNVDTKGALRNLRARSFYLEIMMEHIVDELLDRLNLSRCNLIYSGGGHCYMLLPNTAGCKAILDEFEKELNAWFIKIYEIELFIASGYVECSADELMDKPAGSYRQIYKNMSASISSKKMHRYTASDIRIFNANKNRDNTRECRICRRTGEVGEDGVCKTCRAIEKLSAVILDDKIQNFFVVLSDKTKEDGLLELPFGCYLEAVSEKRLREIINLTDIYKRSYVKNDIYTGQNVATHVWVGNYTKENARDFETLAKSSTGIERVGILRADVDNLGTTFVRGFEDKYMTISRTAALSRHLSIFFKYYINIILKNGDSNHLKSATERNISIVYSGGDDIFIAGAWNDVIDASIDIKKAFEKYTLGSLSISGGIGLYDSKHPVRMMATEVEKLEDYSKNKEGKNAITLFTAYDTAGDGDGRFAWNELTKDVLEEKLSIISDALDDMESAIGKAFLYRILDLYRGKEKIQFARLIYTVSRLEESIKSGDDNKYKNDKKEFEKRDSYKIFKQSIINWMTDAKEKRKAIYAIYMYIYQKRDKEECER